MGYKSSAYAGDRVDLSTVNPKTNQPYTCVVRPLNGLDTTSAHSLAGINVGELIDPVTRQPDYNAIAAKAANDDTFVVRVLSKFILEWDLDADDGSILPITESNIRDLTNKDQMILMSKYNALNFPLANGKISE